MEKKLGRRERKKIVSKKAILSAAVRMFSRQGFQDTSVADIMKEAELGIGTFYNYFSSKEEILQYLLGDIAEEIAQKRMEQETDGILPSEALSQMVLFTSRLLENNRFVLPLFLSAAGHAGLPEGQGHHASAPAFKDIFGQIVAQGQQAGAFRQDIPAGIITEMFHSMFQAASFSSLPVSFAENISYKLRLVMDGIRIDK